MESLLIDQNTFLIFLEISYLTINLSNNLFATTYIGIIKQVVISNSMGVEKSIKLLMNGAITNPVKAPRIL